MEALEALRILERVTSRMSKSEIIERVNAAKVELNLMDIHQVAGQLGGKVGNIRARAINNGLGHKVGRMGRVYTAADVKALRRLIQGGPQPKTVALREGMIKLKKAGLTNKQVGDKLGVHPSYVTKLLKDE